MKEPNQRKNIEPSFQLLISLPEHGSSELLSSLYAQLRAAILEGRLASGVRMPATRGFAASLGVSRNTVMTAYEMLNSEGYLTAMSGAGTHVAFAHPSVKAKTDTTRLENLQALAERRLQPVWCKSPAGIEAKMIVTPRFDFRLGLPDVSYLAFDVWNRMSARALRTLSKTPAQYSQPEGSPLLREVIAGHVSSTRAVASQPRDILVTAGAQQAFDLLARILVTAGKTVVAVEDPGYPPLRDAFVMHGAKLAYVPVDDEGIIIEQIPSHARVVCVTPSHQYPTGVVMSARRRADLLAFSRAKDVCILEDDYDSEFRYDGRPLDALQTLDHDGLVFYVGTFSKSLFPTLRIGFIVMPPWASAALTRAKQLTDWHAPIHVQETLAGFLLEGHFDRHARKMRRIYAERRTSLLDALATHCAGMLTPMLSTAGLHIGVRYHGKRALESYLPEASKRGLGLETFAKYSHTEMRNQGLALGYSSITPTKIHEGIEILHSILTAKRA